MSKNISFRDVKFFPQLTTVQIVVTTDIPCHLYCRLTLTEPDIHKKPMLRRGIAFTSELYFCFVAYEDNEQLEPGDTLEHTWIKPNWPFCTTKYCYFWGYVAGEVAVSTSPPFKYHNNLEIPAPTMFQLMLEPWTYYGPPPPVMSQLILEPWDFWPVPPPTMYQKVLEPWSSYAPPMYQLILEPWSRYGPPPPTMYQKVLEPWTS